ncbi:MAG: hypothetical protein IH991_03820 [Planctomycetes bacterium]|nr:hypothetical protein [Planctomycetota bacterium]
MSDSWFGINIAASRVDVVGGSISGVDNPQSYDAIPAATLLPRVSSESPRADAFWPPHPRGMGLEWPPESNVSKDVGAGRFPLGLALLLAEQDKSWQWQLSASSLDGAEALVTFVQEVTRTTSHRVDVPTVVLAIPNTLGEQGQQALLDHASRLGVQLKLLWQPIAAVLGSLLLEDLRTRAENGELSNLKLVHIHAGLTEFEITLLDLVTKQHSNRQFVLPARSRPNREQSRLISPGLSTIHTLAHKWLRHMNVEVTEGAIWNLIWCTSWIRDVLAIIDVRSEGVRDSHYGPSLPQPDSKFICKEWRDCFFGGIVQHMEADSLGEEHLQRPPTQTEVGKWLQNQRTMLSGQPIVATIITGGLANIQVLDGTSLSQFLVKKLGIDPTTVHVESQNERTELTARGCAEYARRLANDEPTYLDTLPQLRTAISRRGKAGWEDLLPSDHRFVDGGKSWHRDKNLDGLAISRGAESLEIVVHHEDHEHVRKLEAALPRAFEEQFPVSLAVTVTPAQGNAEVEVVPDDRRLFGRRRILADWKTMQVCKDEEGRQLTPDEYLKSLPSAYPELLPRLASPKCWRISHRAIMDFNLSRSPGSTIANSLEQIGTTLLSRDNWHYPREATAIPSSGKVDRGSEQLERFREMVLILIEQNKADIQRQGIRALGYSSWADNQFTSFLDKEIQTRRGDAPVHFVAACGWCLSAPEHVHNFSKAFIQNFNRQPRERLVWLRSMSEVIRYRLHALQDTSSPDCEQITRSALDVFEGECRARKAHYLFRYSAYIIVYLLRRRNYDDKYLDPEDFLADKCKSAFKNAISDHKAKQLQVTGGAFDVEEVLQRMIDYIDRRGSGLLVMGV